MSNLYGNYWEFIRKRNEFGPLKRPVLRWFPSDRLNEVQQAYFDFVSDARTLLDFGAGDLSLKRKFQAAGFRGSYQTLDVSRDYEYDFHSLDELIAAGRKFDAVLVLEVIEHFSLAEFEEFLPKLLSVIAPGGRLILSTPNPQAINAIWAADITHVKAYPQADLWAILTLKGFRCTPHRIVWTTGRWSPVSQLRFQAARILTNLLGVDYAVGSALLCKRDD